MVQCHYITNASESAPNKGTYFQKIYPEPRKTLRLFAGSFKTKLLYQGKVEKKITGGGQNFKTTEVLQYSLPLKSISMELKSKSLPIPLMEYRAGIFSKSIRFFWI
jgi:hypothetical protein